MNIYERLRSMVYVSRLYAQGTAITDDDQRIRASGLYEDWQAGSYQVGDIRNAGGQTWECFQSHDNAVYPDINPDNSAWFTFWRPLHGKSPETARPTDGNVYESLIDNNVWSPSEYPQGWQLISQ